MEYCYIISTLLVNRTYKILLGKLITPNPLRLTTMTILFKINKNVFQSVKSYFIKQKRT